MGLDKDLIDGVQIMIDRAIEKSRFARIRTGLIKSVNANGTYNVLVDDKLLYNAKSLFNTYVENATVEVVFKDNNPNNIFIL